MRSNTSNSERVALLYRAFADRDVVGLVESLGKSFVGHVSLGMPGGVGGVHHGSEAMIRDVWGRVFRDYDICPTPDTVSWTTAGCAVVHGHYRGTHRDSGATVSAEFVHLLEFDDESRISGLRQITDTAAWTNPSGDLSPRSGH